DDSGLGLGAVATIDAGADLLLDLADRGTIRLPVARVDSRALVLGVVEVALGQRERRPFLRWRRLLRLPAVDDSPGLVADHAVRGETVGLLPLLRLGHRGRTPVPVGVGLRHTDAELSTLDGLALRVQLDQRSLAGDRLVGVATTGRAADLDVAGLDAAEHLGPVLGHRGARLVRHRPGELHVQVPGVRVHAVVGTPTGVRVGRAPDLAVPDHTLDAEFLRHGHDGVRQSRAVGGAVGAD